MGCCISKGGGGLLHRQYTQLGDKTIRKGNASNDTLVKLLRVFIFDVFSISNGIRKDRKKL